jgi:hypothetical protein
VHIQDISKVFTTMLKAPREPVHDEAFGRHNDNVQVRDTAEMGCNAAPGPRWHWSAARYRTCATAVQPAPADRDHLDVSVVVCGYTEQCWDQTGAAVASVLGQHPRPAQLLLVADHNFGPTARAGRLHPTSTLCGRKHPDTRNPGGRRMKGTGLCRQ